ncbi:S9 family peptidase [Flavilitoribacter nigricans]|uniref:Acyl-peptide hydrolase n=1 Tax=Flavilitoribacter nigricans (strain ATCC 23147 / DSM 23189 / NBRC 102662 / NCIMB 1420 / SS-2) TaxID=1122177 RepID=A0A2D0NC81_FLAN2|nr:prolyl oligopeptidase family serine peptidase [Flavilitoribacter nigricans]PHN06111.1 prolyl tripeptidyl peptidase precursor [Flavilitoribacter nigricans DSM 23189 = NBRC 102662]
MKKLLFLVLVFSFALHSRAQISIEQLLSAPFPSDLTAGPDGKLLAWVFNDRGERNIYLAGGDQFREVRKLTNYTGDEGIALGSLTFTPDGRQLIYVRGNGTNRSGQSANPAQLQIETGQEIWVVSVDGGEPRSVAKGASPSIAPDGKTLVFLQKGQVWTADLTETGKEARQLFLARGSQGDLRWHPEGRQLAFVSRRGDHSFIGIYDLDSGELWYPDPSADNDGEPVWSPAGDRLAYVRRPNVRVSVPFTPRREGSPWSIRVLRMDNKTAAEVWKADPKDGSVFVGNLPVMENKLLWAAEDQLIFPWEKSGWVHMYALDIRREVVNPLMIGDGEVENARLDANGQYLYYTANIGDINRRHLWRVNIRDPKPELLTEGAGIEWSPVLTAGGLAMLHASATRPAWPALLSEGKIRDLAPRLFPRDFPNGLVRPETVKVTATDGLQVPAQIFLPGDYEAGREYPAVIFLHGGSRRQMLEGFHYSSYYSNAYALSQYFASRGYIAMALNYRSGIGYGLDFREAQDYGVSGASEVRDLIGAAEYLRDRPDVDGNRIGLWGGSYGGYLTAHGLGQRSDLFAVGVDIHGVHNWNTELPTFASWYDSTHYEKIAQLAFQSSPMQHVDGWEDPVLFIHGDDDRNVPFSETVDMIEALRKKGVHFEQLIFPDEVHGFLLHRNWLDAYRTTFQFIDRYLKE